MTTHSVQPLQRAWVMIEMPIPGELVQRFQRATLQTWTCQLAIDHSCKDASSEILCPVLEKA
jgi:hypothetical protein